MQRRPPHRGAADEDRCEPRHRREHAGPADVHLDVLDGRRRLLRRELVRDGPARVARHEAEALLIGDPVDLDDDAVGAVVEIVPLGPPLADEGEDLVDVLRLPHVRIRAQAELAQSGEQRVLRVHLEARGRIAPHRQVALGRGRGDDDRPLQRHPVEALRGAQALPASRAAAALFDARVAGGDEVELATGDT